MGKEGLTVVEGNLGFGTVFTQMKSQFPYATNEQQNIFLSRKKKKKKIFHTKFGNFFSEIILLTILQC